MSRLSGRHVQVAERLLGFIEREMYGEDRSTIASAMTKCGRTPVWRPEMLHRFSEADYQYLEELDRPFRQAKSDLDQLTEKFNAVIKQRDQYAKESKRYFQSFVLTLGLLAISWGLWAVTR